MYLSELLDVIEELQFKHGEDYDPEIEIHFQPSYPLKGKVENIRILDEKLVFAAGDGTEYGSERVWKNEWEEEE